MRQTPSDHGASSTAGAADAGNGKLRQRLLIVEDNPTSREQLKELLQSDNLDVDVAEDGQEALNRLEANNYSIIITDLRMPGLGGLELIRRIQENRFDVAVIVTTGHGSMANAIEAMEHSDAWVERGCSLDDPLLAQERRALVASHSALRRAVGTT